MSLASTVPSSSSAIARAAEHIRSGRLVAFPTETVYGLGGDATNPRAVAAIFATKDRPRFNPLIIHTANIVEAEGLGIFSTAAHKLAAHFWPGGLSLVVPRAKNSLIAELASAGLPSLALRVPAHPVAQALLKASQTPIAAPSANRAGRISFTRAKGIAEEFSGKPEPSLVLDGGACTVGLESTILSCLDETSVLLRQGAIPVEEIERVLGAKIETANEEAGEAARLSPGRLLSHYAPEAKLRLNATKARAGEVLLAFGEQVPEGFRAVRNLSPAGDLTEAAANFFTLLRELDTLASEAGIAAMPVPQEGLGAAINDRLKRAAADGK